MLGFDREHWDELTLEGIKENNTKLIRIVNYPFKHYYETNGKLPEEEFFKEIFDEFDKNDEKGSFHTTYIKYPPIYVAA